MHIAQRHHIRQGLTFGSVLLVLMPVLILFCLMAGSSTAGDIYFWVDENGTRHFTQKPPPENSRLLRKIKEETPPAPAPLPTPDTAPIDPSITSKYGQYRVTRVYDGDSFKAIGQTVTIQVRIAGIDAPETSKDDRPGQPFSERAKKFLESMISNHTVSIKGFGTGAYNRQLAEVFVDGRNVGLELLNAGLAEIYPGPPPADFDPKPYQKAQAAAKAANIGIWSQGRGRITPSRWRKRMRQ